MDAITALVTVIQLIGMFRQERGSRIQLEQQEFLTWLENHRHEELKELISNNAYLNDEVGRLLHEDHASLSQQIAALNTTVTEILANTRQFSRITELLVPDRALSDQAAAILIAFTNSGVRHLIPGKDGTLSLDTTGRVLKVSEARFLNDDLAALVRFGFLSEQVVASGKWRFFELTRTGSAFAKRLETLANEHEGTVNQT